MSNVQPIRPRKPETKAEWGVFLLAEYGGALEPKLPGQRKGPKGVKIAAQDEARAYWMEHPDHEMRWLLPPHLAAIDVDVRPDYSGHDTLKRLTASLGVLPRTPTQASPRAPGCHVLVEIPPTFGWPKDGFYLGKNLEFLRAITVAPSFAEAELAKGKAAGHYKWWPDQSPFDMKPAPLPAAWLRYAEKRRDPLALVGL